MLNARANPLTSLLIRIECCNLGEIKTLVVPDMPVHGLRIGSEEAIGLPWKMKSFQKEKSPRRKSFEELEGSKKSFKGSTESMVVSDDSESSSKKK